MAPNAKTRAVAASIDFLNSVALPVSFPRDWFKPPKAVCPLDPALLTDLLTFVNSEFNPPELIFGIRSRIALRDLAAISLTVTPILKQIIRFQENQCMDQVILSFGCIPSVPPLFST